MLDTKNLFCFFSIGETIKPCFRYSCDYSKSSYGIDTLLPGGIGIVEAVMSILYAALNVGKNIVVTATILDRIISFGLY